jgi:hypothetical protein
MKTNHPRKDNIMFRRFLGTIFLYFYVIPAISRAIRKIVIPEISKVLTAKMREDEKRRRMEAGFEKNNTPDWAREARRQRS